MTDNMTANNTIDPCQLVAGQLLAQQREKLGLTVEECANTLKLSVTKIKALESGDSQPFLSETFIRGYLKSYAKLLNLSEEEVIEGYQSQQANYACATALEQSADETATSKWWLPYLIGAIIICLWFVVSSHLDAQKKTTTVLPEEATALQQGIVNTPNTVDTERSENIVPVVEENAVSGVSHSTDEGVIINTDEPSQLPVLDGVSLVPSEAVELEADGDATEEEIIAPVETNAILEGVEVEELLPEDPSVINELVESVGDTASVDDDQLFFTFAEDCWVEVVDADNVTIVSSLRFEDTQLLVRGKAPFFVILGNISGTTLHFNDEPVALDNSRDGRTLRLNLGS